MATLCDEETPRSRVAVLLKEFATIGDSHLIRLGEQCERM
jgi:hypothetical protein